MTSAHNARLVATCSTPTPRNRNLPAAHYSDSGIKFTVILSQAALPPAPVTREEVIYSVLQGGPATIADLQERTERPVYTIRRALRELRAQGLVEQRGGQGRTTTYQRAKNR